MHWQPVEDWLVTEGSRIGTILLLGIVVWFGLRKFIPPVVRRSVFEHGKGESPEGLENRAKTLIDVFVRTGRVLTVIIILFMILSRLGIPIGPVLAGFGIAGIAIGFGAQYLIRDLIAGSFILMENQYRVGDWVKIGDVLGTVEELTLRKTVIRDWEGMVHHIPNGAIAIATNATRHHSRVWFDMPVAYSTDLDHAIAVINRVGRELAEDENWKSRIKTAPQVLRVSNFGSSSIDIKIGGDVKPREKWTVTGELRLRLKKAFDAEGIEIPFPHTKVYFGNRLECETND